MEIQFLPLELWRASSLAQETKTVIAAYERLVQSGDTVTLAALRRAIEKRIDDLEAFYIAHVDDEKSVLFERQRLKLRRLLHEYDTQIFQTARLPQPSTIPDRTAVPAARPETVEPELHAKPTHSSYAADTDGLVSKEIRDDTRLTLEELVAWFLQGGVSELPDVTTEIVERVFNNVTRMNLDGKMSVRDLRQWYITFGRRALREHLPLDEIVSVGFVKSTAAAAVSARKENVHKKDTLELLSAGVIPVPSTHSQIGGSSSSLKPLYAWEVAGASGTAPTSGRPTSARGSPSLEREAREPMTLPNGILEFQVRLTPEEYAQVQLRKRMLEAEAKYKDRIVSAKEKAAALRGEVYHVAVPEEKATPLHYGSTSLIQTGPYEEPVGKSYFYRSP